MAEAPDAPERHHRACPVMSRGPFCFTEGESCFTQFGITLIAAFSRHKR